MRLPTELWRVPADLQQRVTGSRPPACPSLPAIPRESRLQGTPTGARSPGAGERRWVSGSLPAGRGSAAQQNGTVHGDRGLSAAPQRLGARRRDGGDGADRAESGRAGAAAAAVTSHAGPP